MVTIQDDLEQLFTLHNLSKKEKCVTGKKLFHETCNDQSECTTGRCEKNTLSRSKCIE